MKQDGLEEAASITTPIWQVRPAPPAGRACMPVACGPRSAVSRWHPSWRAAAWRAPPCCNAPRTPHPLLRRAPDAVPPCLPPHPGSQAGITSEPARAEGDNSTIIDQKYASGERPSREAQCLAPEAQ